MSKRTVLEGMQARVRAATDGPWKANHTYEFIDQAGVGQAITKWWSFCRMKVGNGHANMEFCAHARTDMPKLLRVVEAAKASNLYCWDAPELCEALAELDKPEED